MRPSIRLRGRGTRCPLVHWPGDRPAPRCTCASARGRPAEVPRRSVPGCGRGCEVRCSGIVDREVGAEHAGQSREGREACIGLPSLQFTEVTAADVRRAGNGAERKARVRAVTTQVISKRNPDHVHAPVAIRFRIETWHRVSSGASCGGATVNDTTLAWRLSPRRTSSVRSGRTNSVAGVRCARRAVQLFDVGEHE